MTGLVMGDGCQQHVCMQDQVDHMVAALTQST
jgi:hypothetical protein